MDLIRFETGWSPFLLSQFRDGLTRRRQCRTDGLKGMAKSEAPNTGPLSLDAIAQRMAKHADARQAQTALLKKRGGETPTAREREALKRWERDREELHREYYLSSIPKGVYLAMSGRQARTVNEQGVRYGLPITGRHINLPDYIRAMHDFLARNKKQLARHGDPEGGGVEQATTIAERLQLAKATREEIKLRMELGELVRVATIHEHLEKISASLRRACELIQSKGDKASFEILDEAIKEIVTNIETMTDPDLKP
ncbi:MAG: hypothetical protein COA96_16980 [SAR86 cluster bacterium]|uniref:Uncharacterized protein n=1 Tax=SAR86 cluster bacterium TaxID=2030880 RepID=A0A2A5AGA7_9GAMM|nr:MAG: hypothetical protein COA96_16980 [SAR86 cluster bacterium]